MSQNKMAISVLLFLLIFQAAQAQSSKGFGDWGQRAQARESKRWTLQEWLAQKDRNALMDQWLVMNSPSPFEFFLKGAHHSYKKKVDSGAEESEQSLSGALGAYAQAVGLTGEYENNWKENYNDVSGMLSLRFLGNSLQTTSLTLHLGQRTRQLVHNNEKESLNNLFAQLSLQAYLTRYFGIQGHYRQYAPTDNSALGDVSGTLTEGGIFIDFSGLRVFGSWFQDVQNQDLNSVETTIKRTGIKSGLQIFF